MTTRTTDVGLPAQAAPTDTYSDGEDVPDDDPWVLLRPELGPAKTFARMTATARSVVSSVSLVAVALTVVGLLGSAELRQQVVLSVLAAGSGVLALAAAVLALWYGARRPEKFNVHNQIDVKAWVARQVGRAWLVTVASWLLILAVVMAAGVGLFAMIMRSPPPPLVTLSEQGDGTERALALQVKVTDQEPGASIEVVLTAAGGVLYRARGVTDGTGSASITGTVEKVPPADGYRLETAIAGRVTAITLP